MAKITFTADDGSVQEFDVTIPVVAPVAATVTEVDVKESDGTAETFVPEAPAA